MASGGQGGIAWDILLHLSGRKGKKAELPVDKVIESKRTPVSLHGCSGKAREATARALVTCPASPGGKLSYLIPSLLLEIVALHAPNGFGRLPTNHDHHLGGK